MFCPPVWEYVVSVALVVFSAKVVVVVVVVVPGKGAMKVVVVVVVVPGKGSASSASLHSSS